MVRGENGHAEHSAAGLGDALLAFFDKLLRELPEDRVCVFVVDVLREAREQADAELVKNLFVLAFQTRWCRGGKGERQVGLCCSRFRVSTSASPQWYLKTCGASPSLRLVEGSSGPPSRVPPPGAARRRLQRPTAACDSPFRPAAAGRLGRGSGSPDRVPCPSCAVVVCQVCPV